VVRDCGAEVGVEVEAAANEAIERLDAKRKELADHVPPRENLWRLTNAKYLRDFAVWRQEEDWLEKEKSVLAEELAAAQRRQSPEWQTGEAERRAVLRDPELASELAIKGGGPASLEFVWDIRKKDLAAAIRAWAIREKADVEPKLKAHEELDAAHEKTCPEKARGVLTLYRAVGYKKRHDVWMDRRRELECDRSSLEKRLTELEEFATTEHSESSAEGILRFADPRLASALDQARDKKEQERQKEIQRRKAEEQRREAERRKNAPPRELADALWNAAENESRQRPLDTVLELYPQLSAAVEARQAIAKDPDFRPDRGLANGERLSLATGFICELIAQGDLDRFLELGSEAGLELIKEKSSQRFEELNLGCKELKLERELEKEKELELGAPELDMEEDLEL
jgi:hypothetical protein